MVAKLFWENPYQTELDTQISSISGNQVALSETIFFAFSGGQESDRGTINGHPVLNAEKQGKEIFYTLESTAGLRIDDLAHVQIDWPRRYQLMRLHFATEIVLELIYKSHPHATKTGAHIAEDKARIDFEWDGNIADLFVDLMPQIEQIINADLTIECGYSDPNSERRYWKIDGFAEIPCGGTHVRSTGDIGPIRLKRKNPGKGKERIEIFIETATD